MRMNMIEYKYFVFRPLTLDFYNKNYNEVFSALDLDKYELIDVGESIFETASSESILFFVNDKDRLLNQVYNQSEVKKHWFTGTIILIVSEDFEDCALYYDNTPMGIFRNTNEERHFEIVRVLNNSESDSEDPYSRTITESLSKQLNEYNSDEEIKPINYFKELGIGFVPSVNDVIISA